MSGEERCFACGISVEQTLSSHFTARKLNSERLNDLTKVRGSITEQPKCFTSKPSPSPLDCTQISPYKDRAGGAVLGNVVVSAQDK